MFKRHHKLIIVLTVIGGLYLLYLLLKNRGGSGASAGADQLPYVITAGGGAIAPTIPSYAAQNFDSGVGMVAPQTTGPLTYSVMPGTSGSGVPQHTPQAQEFDNSHPISGANPAAATPSFYSSAQELSYVNIDNPTYVSEKFGKNATSVNPDLQSFLNVQLRGFEVSAQNAIGNEGVNTGVKQVEGTGGLRTSDELKQIFTGSAGDYCAMHPDACHGDTNSLVSDLVSQYTDFVNSARAQKNPGVGQSVPVTETLTPASQPAPANNGVGNLRGVFYTPGGGNLLYDPAALYNPTLVH